MITYVNTVFVSNNATSAILTKANFDAINASNVATYKGRFVVYDIDNNEYSLNANSKTTNRFKIGMITGEICHDHKGVARPIIKWSNVIQVADIKSLSFLEYKANSEDTVTVDFTGATGLIGSGHTLSTAGKRIITRITYKDMPHRYRKWTESYEYVTADGDTATTIAAGIANLINKQWKRARVNASANAGVLTLTALPYDDDNAVETLNWAEKVRFNVNLYYTDPGADGWESLNKHNIIGISIAKTPGFRYAAAKLVRDREAQGMGYEGILNRGEGTWPIIKPAMQTNLEGQYNAITLEFENMYRAADDIFRKTKQTVEIYCTADVKSSGNAVGVLAELNKVVNKNYRTTVDTQTEDGAADA